MFLFLFTEIDQINTLVKYNRRQTSRERANIIKIFESRFENQLQQSAYADQLS